MGMLISIDNGGTLTDACVIADGKVFHAKTLTTPHDLTQCFIEVLRQISRRVYGEARLDTLLEEVDYIRYSTTQGTNAVVQRKGPRLGLLLPVGQDRKALVRNQAEDELLQALVGDRIAKLDLSLNDEALESEVISAINELMSRGANRLVVSLGGGKLVEDESRIKRLALLRYPRHLLGAVPILYSHQLSDDADDARRTWSGLLNAFLHPAMERFLYNAEGVLRERRARNPLLIFCNDGTSSRVAKTIALKTWGSGPRGGMEGAKALAQHYGRKTVLTMDIGGTTTDIGVVEAGTVREDSRGQLEDVQISFPLCEVESLGAGGSSVFRVVDGKLRVGPESVGGAPGPACFGYGGKEATITDALLLLGILDGESYFGGSLKLDAERARTAVIENVAKPLNLSLDQALAEMEHAYVDKIAAAMSHLGGKPEETSLLAFGGAGPMSACKVAERLGLREIIVPRMAAVFSAFGIGFSDIAHGYNAALGDASVKSLGALLEQLNQRAQRDMYAEGFDLGDCTVEKSLSWAGKDGQITVHRLNGKAELPEGAYEAADLRVQLRATKEIPHFHLSAVDTKAGVQAQTRQARTVRLADDPAKSGNLTAKGLPLFRHEELQPGQWGMGPAIVEEEYFTCYVASGWRFLVNDNRDLVLNKQSEKN
ncbi:hydantoinase/oxoprolinase family protein [Nevskia soli]|uniref:hydantoinase/oxoprolinase family protein n=1 Tax=Nevskia soli TaxID=418856 RepID=UPI0004A6ADCA|nr:hydantoinase/oxoprolinase family protein [Nevskia soli]